MDGYTIVLGNRNYSSWSMRAWLALRQTGIAFEEMVIPLHQDDSQHAKERHSAAGKVPVLHHGDRTVWDSLAIAEYLAEQFPEAGLWPGDPAARAVARSACAEMHSSFLALRTHMPLNCRASRPGRGHIEAVAADVRRIEALWRDCRQRFAGDDPYLFGACCLADHFFAPVASRLRTYDISLDGASARYVQTLLDHPDVREWHEAARAEPWSIAQYDEA